MSPMPVHIVDDDPAVVQSVAFMLKAEGIDTTAHEGAEQLLEALPGLEPGCILLDLRLCGMSGLELQRLLHDHGCAMPVVMMTGHGSVDSAVAAMKEGAIDFIQKPFAKADLMAALDCATRRLTQRDRQDDDKAQAETKICTLSLRERQVVSGLARGNPNKVIAYDLGISPRTVEIHRSNAMKKLEVRTLPDLLHVAFLAGLMDD